MKRVAGIVLAGGNSRRMGADKATLAFGSELLLQRVVRIVGQAVSPVVVVAARDQSLPTLPTEVIVARDEIPDHGPLEGIAAALRILRDSFPDHIAAFITACDAPLITAAFIGHMIELLGAQYAAAVPLLDDIPQPLAGAYSVKILPAVESMLADDCLALRDLVKRIPALLVPAEELRRVDPDLLSLRNLNTPVDYHAALATAGFTKDNRSL
jgi:molybdenum cofactor guanylyltransferase